MGRRSGRPIGRGFRHQGPIFAAAFRPDGAVIVTGGEDNVAWVWDAATGRALGPPLEHEGTVRGVAVSPDGRAVLTGGNDRTARLWDLATSKPIGPPRTYRSTVMAVAFSPDGRSALTGGRDPVTRTWPVAAPVVDDVARITLWARVLTGVELDFDANPTGMPRVLDGRAWWEASRRLDALGGAPRP